MRLQEFDTEQNFIQHFLHNYYHMCVKEYPSGPLSLQQQFFLQHWLLVPYQADRFTPLFIDGPTLVDFLFNVIGIELRSSQLKKAAALYIMAFLNACRVS
jgi:hypothetical protein